MIKIRNCSTSNSITACFFLIILYCIFGSCQNPSKSESDKAIDSLNKKIMILTDRIDSITEQKHEDVDIEKKGPANEHEFKKDPSLTQKKVFHKASSPVKEDTLKYYYKNSNKLSLIIAPWIERKRQIIFYNPSGQITYKIEDIKISFTSVTEINKFHENGAVALITIKLHPDASMYWYQSVISFGIDNIPEWKEDFQYPEEHVILPGSNKSFWQNGTWKKKEKLTD